MKLGRPPLLEAQKQGKITGVRLRGDDRALVEKAAYLDGKKLSAWIRLTLLAAAAERTKRP